MFELWSSEDRDWHKSTVVDARLSQAFPVLISILSLVLMQGCGNTVKPGAPPANISSISLKISPDAASLVSGGNQQFKADVSGISNQAVTWSVAATTAGNAGSAAIGAITANGLYSAPVNLAANASVTVVATSVADPTYSASATATINAASVLVTPATATVQAGKPLAFSAKVAGLTNSNLNWIVNGISGGNPVIGTISADGLYAAPSIDPGLAISVRAASIVDSRISGTAVLAIANLAPPKLVGATYSDLLNSWDTLMLPWIDTLAGLTWDPAGRIWNTDPLWKEPARGIGPDVYFLEEALRPATRMAIARQDVSLMEELALFHLALLQHRATTLRVMRSDKQPDDIVFIDGQDSDRTFAWYEPLAPGSRRIREWQLSNSQYLSTGARLLRAVAEMPAASRTPTLIGFASIYGHFLVSEQLLRLLYGTTWWAHWQNPDIGNPVVSAWKFLAANPAYKPVPPHFQYEAAVSDIELWLIMDTAEVVAADVKAPELGLMDSGTRQMLTDAVLSGTALMQARCHHVPAPDGADVLSTFAGEWEDYPDFAYSDVTTPQTPSVASPRPDLAWDSSHAYRFPIIFRSLYETSTATGATFPARGDLVALANSYVHQTLDQGSILPAFNNYLDGADGWFQVDRSTTPSGGYPPHRDCDGMNKGNCLTVGAVQGWGQLSFINPDLAALEQRLLDLAYDDSPSSLAFKDQYYYADGHYSVDNGLYPWLMVWVAGDGAELLPQ